MDWLLVAVALIAAVLSLVYVTQATLGACILIGACLLAILARMVQASHHTDRIARALDAQTRALSAGQQPPAPAPVILQTDTWLCFRCGQHVNGKHDVCSACGLARPGA